MVRQRFLWRMRCGVIGSFWPFDSLLFLCDLICSTLFWLDWVWFVQFFFLFVCLVFTFFHPSILNPCCIWAFIKNRRNHMKEKKKGRKVADGRRSRSLFALDFVWISSLLLYCFEYILVFFYLWAGEISPSFVHVPRHRRMVLVSFHCFEFCFASLR